MKVHVVCTCTGVKYLHHAALDFDIGIYFEANGHGTVTFSDKVIAMFTNTATSITNDGANSGALDARRITAVKQLTQLPDLINQYIGDALSDLLVEAALLYKNWTLQQWNALYTDLPSKMGKVVVPDRRMIQTTNAERTCTAPAGLQQAIDEAVAKVEQGRSFVRPSGTEDIVRVFAEGGTPELVQSPCKYVQRLGALQYCSAPK